MKIETKAVRFLESLKVPEGPRAGRKLKLAPFQKDFVQGALSRHTTNAVLSIGRGNAKTALSAGIGLGALVGAWDNQPRREILIAARTQNQARVAWEFVQGLARTLPDDELARIRFRRSPRLEIEYEDAGGVGHFLRAISSDGKSALGTSPTLAIMDERGHWPIDKGDDLENALMSGLGKRGGKALMISTSASDDSHPFSRWIDDPLPGTYVQEHRPAPSLPADDVESLILANPGAAYGIGSSIEWLEAQAKRAIQRGGSTLASFRLYNRNERVAGETRDVLLTVDEWLNCEVDALPPRAGPCIIGIDLGGSASMTAVAYYWPETFRLEVYGTFPSQPNLHDRGINDGVSARYVEMRERGELGTMGMKTVPISPWLKEVMSRVPNENIAALVADRYKQAEVGEAIDKANIRVPIVWRGQGFRDGGEDCERFRRAAFDQKIMSEPSLLLRSAFADAVCLRDPANNLKLAKARSQGRIDAASASVLAVAEGVRRVARSNHKGGRIAWG